MLTPWGESQHTQELAPGITLVHTAGHGGVHVARARARSIPRHLMGTDGHGGIWYEEDSEVCLLVLAKPELFSQEQVKIAERTVRNHYPEAWEAHFKRSLRTEESLTLSRRQFAADTRDKLVAVAAVIEGDAFSGFVRVWATPGGERSRIGTDDERAFLVPACEYDARSHLGFVVDEFRHIPCG